MVRTRNRRTPAKTQRLPQVMHQSLLPPPRVSATVSKLEKIIEDLKLAESKKEALRLAFETLKSNAASVASFTLQWSDLEAHFSSLHSSIQSRLGVLQSQLQQIESNPTTLTDLFRHKQPNSIYSQVSRVIRSSPSPATLVLDTIPLLLNNGKGDFEKSAVKDCVLLLKQLVQFVSIPAKVDDEVREKARRLAVEWKEKMRVECIEEVMGFLNILGIYGLVGEFDRAYLLGLFEVVAGQNVTPELCRVLELEETMPEFIQKLIMKEKQLQAIKFIYEFELLHVFPPVELIKAHLKCTRKAIKKIRKRVRKVSTEGQKEDARKALAALRAAVKCISKYKLEAKTQLEPVREWIKELENLNREKETTAAATDPTPSPAPYSTTAPTSATKAQPQQQTGKKRSPEELEAQANQQCRDKRQQTAVMAGATPNGHPSTFSSVTAMQSHHFHPAGLLNGQASPYLTAPPRYYAPSASAPANPHMNVHYGSTNFNPVNQYMMPPAQQYGSSIRAVRNTGTTNLGVAASIAVRQFNLARIPAGMAANANANWPGPPIGHGYRP